jgi:hypothetical protein
VADALPCLGQRARLSGVCLDFILISSQAAAYARADRRSLQPRCGRLCLAHDRDTNRTFKDDDAMNPRTIFGGNPLGVILRLALLSVVVGVVLSALGITPQNFLYHIEVLLRRIYDLGFATFDWFLQYLILGAIIVVPIWLIARLFGAFGRRDGQ